MSETRNPAVPTQPEPIHFRGREQRAEKHFWRGTQRTISPRETLDRVRPWFERAGITRLADITHLDRIGIPTTLAIRPNSPTLANSSGKGLTLDAAFASAAMEAIELYHAEGVELPEFRLPYERLGSGYSTIPVDLLPLTRNSLFHVGLLCDWTLGWDLLHQEEVAVPISVIDMVRGRRSLCDLRPFQISSNGLASGNDFLEALSSALFEVIERDAIACQQLGWSKHGRHPPLVRKETIDHPFVLELLARFQAAEVEVLIFDCTVDTAIPVYMAYVIDRVHRQFGIFKGYGAHLDPEVAMIRAVTEAAQSRLIYIAGSRDDLFRHDFSRLKRNDTEEGLRFFRGLSATSDARERRSDATPTFEGDVGLTLARLKAAGLEQVVVFELRRPDFPLHVVKVVVPGLEGYKFDFYTPGPRARVFLQRFSQ